MIAGKRPVVLIVEDSADSRDLYIAYLSRRNIDVLEAEDGSTGIELAVQRTPDVVIMDLSLPDMDGLRAIDILKSNPRTRHVPIIVLSGDSSVYELGGEGRWDVFLRKPCMPPDLLATIMRLVEPSAQSAAP